MKSPAVMTSFLVTFGRPAVIAFHHSSLQSMSQGLSARPTAAIGHRRLFASPTGAAADPSSLSSDKLCNLAKSFIDNKNAAGRGDSTLDPVFDMCSPDVDLYGLKGDDVRPFFVSFFQKHEGLYHELMEEPTVVGSKTVQYPFIKTWKDQESGAEKVWKSIDPDKPRNKVERLGFDEEGRLVTVTVVEADAPLA